MWHELMPQVRNLPQLLQHYQPLHPLTTVVLCLLLLFLLLSPGTLESSTKAVRQVVLQRSIAEYQAQANAESQRCAVCMEAPRRLAFQCGHQTCHNCGDKITSCPFCRQDITAKIRLFE
jgi:hypothetical protein